MLITNSLAIIKYRNFCILQSINTIYLHIPEATYETMNLRIADIINYIENLKLPSGQTILTSQRKTGFLGIIIYLKNVFNLYDTSNK